MKKGQCDVILQLLVYSAFKKFLHGVNDGLGYSMKGNSMRQRYSESICNLITQENSKGIKSFRLF